MNSPTQRNSAGWHKTCKTGDQHEHYFLHQQEGGTRIIVRGNSIHYPEDQGIPTVDLITVKLLLNSVISTNGAKFMAIDIKGFYPTLTCPGTNI